jgi:release factor glutamine methyltransferase
MVMNYLEWLQNAAKQLKDAGIKTARLDAFVLLQAATGTDRAHIIAYPETVLEGQNLEVADGYLTRRIKREPVAYILGTKEFYGRDFIVTPDVLVPRPESEAIIELLAKFGPLSGKHLLDVGTGSGALAITAKLENPKLQVVGSDISADALNIARENAAQLNADVDFVESSLLQDITDDFDIIVANLPYVPPDYIVEPELSFEPALALYADHGGLKLIEEFIKQTPGKLLPGGVVLIECLTSQHADVKRMAKEAGFRFNQKNGLILAFTY